MWFLVPCAESDSWEAAATSAEIFLRWRSIFRSSSRRVGRSAGRRRTRPGGRSSADGGGRRSDSNTAGRRTCAGRARRSTRRSPGRSAAAGVLHCRGACSGAWPGLTVGSRSAARWRWSSPCRRPRCLPRCRSSSSSSLATSLPQAGRCCRSYCTLSTLAPCCWRWRHLWWRHEIAIPGISNRSSSLTVEVVLIVVTAGTTVVVK